MAKDTKSGVSWKTKLIISIVAVAALIGLGIYLGIKFQNLYTRFAFGLSMDAMKFVFWLVIILAAALVIYIFYLVHKIKQRREQKRLEKERRAQELEAKRSAAIDDMKRQTYASDMDITKTSVPDTNTSEDLTTL